MIAVDTNVLVRLLVIDDPRHHEVAKAFFRSRLSAAVPGFVSLLVIAETYWVLTTVYKFSAEAVRSTLLAVIDSEQVFVEQPAIVREALGAGSTDVADLLIHLIGQEAGCRSTVTFDKRFARHVGVELLE